MQLRFMSRGYPGNLGAPLSSRLAAIVVGANEGRHFKRAGVVRQKLAEIMWTRGQAVVYGRRLVCRPYAGQLGICRGWKVEGG